MKKLEPPKRRVLKNGIPLNDCENARFLRFVKSRGLERVIETFIAKTGLYLRGRWDGPARSGTDPCGYVFISEDSFDKGHAPIMFFDPMPSPSPLKISFRSWKSVLPFDESEWDNLDGGDRLQKKMRIIELTSDKKLARAIKLSKIARQTFEELFDLTVNLLKNSKARVSKNP